MKGLLSASMAVLFALICFTSCKKSSNNNVYGNKIILSPLVVNGNTVTLKWSKLPADSLTSYLIERVTDTVSNYMTSTITVDKNTNQYVDTLPLAPYVQYYITSVRTGIYSRVTSNKITYARQDISFMLITPKDAVVDRASHMLYIYSSTGDIIKYDLQGKNVAKQISTSANIGYCDIGVYNGTKELYVPRSDGWLFIYDATTLTQIDQINIGNSLTSVVFNNGVLFVSGIISYSSSSAIVSYNRATKSLISSQSTSDASRLKLIPGSNSEFLGVSTYSNPYYFKFDSTGHYVTQQTGYLSGYYLSPTAFEIFPDGSKFITSSTGVIVSKALTYVSSLPHGNLTYTSYDFDNTNQLIYVGCATNKIQAYSLSSYQLSNTINTKGYPTKIFYDNGSVISLSTINNYGSYGSINYAFIEQF